MIGIFVHYTPLQQSPLTMADRLNALNDPSWRSLDGAELAKRNPGFSGHDHRFGQHPSLHRYQLWQAGSPVDCYGRNDDHGRY
jgi:hypothetical protein